jgi:L-ascorbate metabolism protein UlaG (beta-lactamase superfamily)
MATGGHTGEASMDISDIHWLGHDSFRLDGSTTIYIDPWKLPPEPPVADGILLTHDHYDHLSADDIDLIAGPQTIIIGPQAVADQLEGDTAVVVAAGETFQCASAVVTAVPAYNVNKYREPGKPYHPREAGYLGYVIELDGFSVYHSGDTDVLADVECDVALIPVSGTYVMTAEEAVEACRRLRAKAVVPMHYADIVGTKADAERLKAGCGERVVMLPLERG